MPIDSNLGGHQAEEKARLMFFILIISSQVASVRAFLFVLSPISYPGWRVTRHGLMVLHVLSFGLFPLVIFQSLFFFPPGQVGINFMGINHGINGEKIKLEILQITNINPKKV